MRASWVVVWGCMSAACNGAEFSCSDAAQCVLSGTQGICDPSGQCAYPDEACESGYRFPPGAAGSVAGECTGGDPPGTGEETSDDTVGSTSMSSSTAPSTSVAEVGPMTSPSDPTVVMTSDDPSLTSEPMMTDSGLMPCVQEPGEPNDEVDDAVPVAQEEMCTLLAAGAVGGADIADFYAPQMSFDPDCFEQAFRVDVDPNQSLRRCVQMACEGGMQADTVCSGGSVVGGPLYTTCCGTSDFDITMGCSDGGPLTFAFYVEGGDECVEYSLKFGL